jgi:hypothetical protein
VESLTPRPGIREHIRINSGQTAPSGMTVSAAFDLNRHELRESAIARNGSPAKPGNCHHAPQVPSSSSSSNPGQGGVLPERSVLFGGRPCH